MSDKSTRSVPLSEARRTPEQPPMPTVVAQRYRIQGEIGRGGMGTVYRVEHLFTGELLALKVLNEQGLRPSDAMERFKREARAPALIRSEHVVRVTDADFSPELNGLPFFVMELLDGKNLEERVAQDGPLKPAEVVAIFTQMAKALDRAHAIGIVHRDLKPANLFLARTDTGTTLKILDFGVSKILEDKGKIKGALTFDGALLGTIPYMAPEQATGRSLEACPETDLWAAGLIAFSLLTGKSYWQGERLGELLHEILFAPMPPPSSRAEGLSTAFDEWFARACHRHPKERFPSASEQAAALGRAFAINVPPLGRDLPSLTEPGTSAAPVDSSRGVRDTILSDRPPPDRSSFIASRVLAVPQTPVQARERRQVTVLHCAVEAMSESSDDVDPEDLADLLREIEDAIRRALQSAPDVLVRPIGDGQGVYFGLPVASENDAARAVEMALFIAEEVAAVSAAAAQPKALSGWVSMGVHTGVVVVEPSPNRSEAFHIVGQAPSIAMRLGQLAGPNTVVISGETFRMVGERFACEHMPTAVSSGSRTRTEAYRVLPGERESTAPLVAPKHTKIVGRMPELATLTNRWDGLKEGAGHVAVLIAEAGIGKSRLLRAFAASLQDESHHWFECRCTPQGRNTALGPMIAALYRFAGIDRGDQPEVRRAKIERSIAPFSLPNDADLLLSSLVAPSLPLPALLGQSPERQKERTFEVLTTLFSELTTLRPLCFVVEDLQWADPSTQELVRQIVESCPSNGIFVLLTCRPEYALPWPVGLHVSAIVLPKLSRTQVEELIHDIAGKDLPPRIMGELVSRTDGVPLFVEELTKAVLERGGSKDEAGALESRGPTSSVSIPATLRDSLMARLDNLGKAKRTAQLAATIGRELTFELLRRVSTESDEELVENLAILTSREILQRLGNAPRARFVFKHGLMQEVAYESLSKTVRRQYHRRIAEELELSFPVVADTTPEQLAHHWLSASVYDRAIGYLVRAGQNALRRSANVEAVGQLKKALELVELLPESHERTRLEISVSTLMGVPLMATKSYAAPEVERTYARALELGTMVGEHAELFPATWGLWIFYLVRGRYGVALSLADQLSRVSGSTSDPSLRLIAHIAQGNTHIMLGDFYRAKTEFEQSIMLSDGLEGASALAYTYGQDPAMYARGFLSWTLWLLGFPADAEKMGDAAIACARAASHPNSIAFALCLDAWLHRYLRDTAGCAARANELVSFASAQRLPFWLAHGERVQGLCMAIWGKSEEGLLLARKARNNLNAMGQVAGNSHYDLEFVDAYIGAGRVDEARELLDEVASFVEETAERSFAPEVDRLRGQLMLSSGDHEGAKACFNKAINSARSAGAYALVLRAALDKAHIMIDEGDSDSARAALASALTLFPLEKDMSADLKHARELIEKIGCG